MEERLLRVNKTKITGGSNFNGDNFVAEGSYDSNNDEKILFWVFSLISRRWFNP